MVISGNCFFWIRRIHLFVASEFSIMPTAP